MPDNKKNYTEDELLLFYTVKCPFCGWIGLSRDCAGGLQIADTGDYDDPLCPVCLSKGMYHYVVEDTSIQDVK